MYTHPRNVQTQLELNEKLLAGQIQQLENNMREYGATWNDRLLKQKLNQRLGQIERAKQQIVNGQYGICECCGYPIPNERLEAIPEATMCVFCIQQALKGQMKKMTATQRNRKETTYAF